MASVWEIGIKTSIGKLQLRGKLTEVASFLIESDIGLLPISSEHIVRLQALPFHHRDPFDRLLIAQAFTEHLTLLTRDGVFKKYEVPALW